jgi:hypothetical protein
MAMPKNKDGIRAQRWTRNGIQLIHFVEYPGYWIVSPEYDRKKLSLGRNAIEIV